MDEYGYYFDQSSNHYRSCAETSLFMLAKHNIAHSCLGYVQHQYLWLSYTVNYKMFKKSLYA